MQEMLKISRFALDIPRPQQHADNVAANVCKLIEGSNCFITSYTELDNRAAPTKGSAVVVTLEDPATLFSDTRKVALLWDNQIVEAIMQIDEGKSGRHIIDSVRGERLYVWVDDDIPGSVMITTPDKARQILDDEKKEANKPTKVPNPLGGLFDKVGTAYILGAVLIGAAVIAGVVIIAKNGKIPTPG